MERAQQPVPIEQRYLDVPYAERWEKLKPAIVDLYLGQGDNAGLKYPALVQTMKDLYGFSAEIHQYRYQITKKWGIKKRITTNEKKEIISILGKRMRPGTSTSDVKIMEGGIEKHVDKKQLKRFVKDRIRHQPELHLSVGMLSSWNVPPNALFPRRSNLDQPSPLANTPGTPGFMTINSPKLPGSSGSPMETTPVAQLVQKQLLNDRTSLLVQGHHDELMKQLNDRERRFLVSYLHEFWMYSFITAKFWGRGPREWTPYLIQLRTLGHDPEDPPSPHLDRLSLDRGSLLSPIASQTGIPSQLCRWSIHYRCLVSYDRVPSPPLPEGSEELQDFDDESTWLPWRTNESGPQIQDKLQEGLEDSSFTKLALNDLPLSSAVIVEAVQKSPDELKAESLAFMIMSGNLNSLSESWLLTERPPTEISKIYPFHLAASFMDGSRDCCTVMEFLVRNLEGLDSISSLYQDHRGHTVLDVLMVKILSSHTSVCPAMISEAFHGQNRFPGEDRDICGRWDADSPCVRKHYARGNSALPFEWKHPFCHTATQAICHSITCMFIPDCCQDINTPSGLFLKICNGCRTELRLLPLHALVVVTFYLANNGTQGETLFGALAVLVRLLTLGADPTIEAEISIPAILGSGGDESNCQHSRLNPSELAAEVPLEVTNNWTPEAQLGWDAFTRVLNSATEIKEKIFERTLDSYECAESPGQESGDDNNEEICYCDYDSGEHFGGNIGTLWAIIQAELLSYRRINESDGWISKNFDISMVVRSFTDGSGLDSIPLVRNHMLKYHSECGLYSSNVNRWLPNAEEVCSFHFMNMDDWRRTSFIEDVPNAYVWF